MSIGAGFEREAETLASISEQLADAAIDLLSDAVRHGGDEKSEAVRIERELQRARRSIAKAEEILRGITSARDD